MCFLSTAAASAADRNPCLLAIVLAAAPFTVWGVLDPLGDVLAGQRGQRHGSEGVAEVAADVPAVAVGRRRRGGRCSG